jgi:hypothetical protein
MANTKLNADGYAITAWFGLPNFAVNPAKPTVAELTAATNITTSIAWENFSFGAQASNQQSDPSIGDVGNTQTRGFAQFGGTLSFFYPYDYTDASNPLLTTFNLLDAPRTAGYLIFRVDGLKTTSSAPDKTKGPVVGDFITVYKVLTDGWTDVNTGEANFKYTITFQPQGDLWFNATVNTTVTIATPVAIGATAYTAGGKTPLGAYFTGRQLALSAGFWNGTPGYFNWTSSNSAIASVDKNGVVKGVAAGGPVNIIATDPNTGIASTALAVTIT